MSLAANIEHLKQFAISHLGPNEDVNRLLRLKLEHSQKVLENAELILKGENIDGRLADLCRLAALYHDIGRFPQLVRFQTFNDKKSVNHGKLGALILRDMHLPGPYSRQEWRKIRFAVAQHNALKVTPKISDEVKIMTHVVRDADKLDIYRVLAEHFTSDNPDQAVTLNLEQSPDQYTEELLDEVISGRLGDYAKARYINDFKILVIGWLNDIQFKTTFHLVKKHTYMTVFFSLLPKTKRIAALEKKMHNLMRYQLSAPS